jgi:hypothetical protein
VGLEIRILSIDHYDFTANPACYERIKHKRVYCFPYNE